MGMHGTLEPTTSKVYFVGYFFGFSFADVSAGFLAPVSHSTIDRSSSLVFTKLNKSYNT